MGFRLFIQVEFDLGTFRDQIKNIKNKIKFESTNKIKKIIIRYALMYILLDMNRILDFANIKVIFSINLYVII